MQLFTDAISFGSSKTGLEADLRAQPVKADGTFTGDEISGIFFEVGGGVYNVSGAVPDDATHVIYTCVGDATIHGAAVVPERPPVGYDGLPLVSEAIFDVIIGGIHNNSGTAGYYLELAEMTNYRTEQNYNMLSGVIVFAGASQYYFAPAAFTGSTTVQSPNAPVMLPDPAPPGYGGSGGGGSPINDGDTAVDHNTGGPDYLRVMSGGQPVDNARVQWYLRSEWDANRPTAQLKGKWTTLSDGRAAEPAFVDAGFEYAVVADKPGQMSPQTKYVEVTA